MESGVSCTLDFLDFCPDYAIYGVAWGELLYVCCLDFTIYNRRRLEIWLLLFLLGIFIYEFKAWWERYTFFSPEGNPLKWFYHLFWFKCSLLDYEREKVFRCGLQVERKMTFIEHLCCAKLVLDSLLYDLTTLCLSGRFSLNDLVKFTQLHCHRANFGSWISCPFKSPHVYFLLHIFVYIFPTVLQNS